MVKRYVVAVAVFVVVFIISINSVISIIMSLYSIPHGSVEVN